jgi:hypothetical protein
MTSDQLDAQLPALTLTFPDGNGGTFALTMKPTQSYIPPTLSGGTTFYCSGLFQNMATTTGTIFGTSAMLGSLVIFDIDGHRIGFAPQSYCP